MEELVKIAMLRLTSNVQSEKREISFFKEDICRLVLDFVGGGRLNNNLFYLMGSEIDDATAGSTMSVASLVGLWFLP